MTPFENGFVVLALVIGWLLRCLHVQRNRIRELQERAATDRGLVYRLQGALVDADEFPNDFCDALEAIADADPEPPVRSEQRRQVAILRNALTGSIDER